MEPGPAIAHEKANYWRLKQDPLAAKQPLKCVFSLMCIVYNNKEVLFITLANYKVIISVMCGVISITGAEINLHTCCRHGHYTTKSPIISLFS